ncbi:MAG: SGNH/GDSL hydrolase family protein [Solobacterium sp.]|jgi:hypothetical protein|nr:SGNH/GDSL hydrolase family protein [Solobacterium sp.]
MMKKTLTILTAFCLLCGCAPAEVEEQPAEEEQAYACRYIDFYDYNTPVPASEPIQDMYFEDTIFGGDSRMGSLYLFSNLRDRGAEIHYVTSLSLWRIYDMELETAESNLYDILISTDRSSIYMLIGINEIRSGDFTAWAEEYQTIVQDIRNAHPQCDIYLILAYHPEEISGLDANELSAHLKMENDGLIQVAQTEHVYYLNPDEALTGSDGIVMSDIVWDGLHLNETGSQMFADFIATHVVRKDVYVKEVCE